jgi:5-methylcytosine-specific restriction protein A
MGTCSVCLRTGSDLPTERHHLVPENRKHSPVAEVCTPCHKQLHALFTNDELREDFDTVEALREADRMREYLAWIRPTKKTDIQVRTSEHVRERR